MVVLWLVIGRICSALESCRISIPLLVHWRWLACMMYGQRLWARPLDYPKTSLIVAFTAWKLLLACIAILSPGSGYDTSTLLLYPNQDATKMVSWPDSILKSWLRNLTRWDAIYFTQIARRGYVWEQEWAFGWGFTKLISFAVRSESAITKCSRLETEICSFHIDGLSEIIRLGSSRWSDIVPHLSSLLCPRTA